MLEAFWPASVAGREAWATDRTPPSSTTGGGFSPFPPTFKVPPVRSGADGLAFFGAFDATSFPFLFRGLGGTVGSLPTAIWIWIVDPLPAAAWGWTVGSTPT